MAAAKYLHQGGGMKNLLKLTAVLGLLLVGSPASAQVSFGISIGAPPPPRAYRVAPYPGPDYTWVEGYWYPQRGRYRWRDGYWARPPFATAYWVAPYYSGGRYFAGRWEDYGRRSNNNRGWDRGRDRDGHRGNNRRR